VLHAQVTDSRCPPDLVPVASPVPVPDGLFLGLATTVMPRPSARATLLPAEKSGPAHFDARTAAPARPWLSGFPGRRRNVDDHVLVGSSDLATAGSPPVPPGARPVGPQASTAAITVADDGLARYQVAAGPFQRDQPSAPGEGRRSRSRLAEVGFEEKRRAVSIPVLRDTERPSPGAPDCAARPSMRRRALRPRSRVDRSRRGYFPDHQGWLMRWAAK
jgi:hypothetical protein